MLNTPFLCLPPWVSVCVFLSIVVTLSRSEGLLPSPPGLRSSLAVLWVQGTESPLSLITCYLNHAQEYLFLPRNTSMEEMRVIFQSLGRLSESQKPQPSPQRPLASSRQQLDTQDMGSVFHRCQLSSPPTFSKLPSHLQHIFCCAVTGSCGPSLGGTGAHPLGFCSH